MTGGVEIDANPRFYLPQRRFVECEGGEGILVVKLDLIHLLGLDKLVAQISEVLELEGQ